MRARVGRCNASTAPSGASVKSVTLLLTSPRVGACHAPERHTASVPSAAMRHAEQQQTCERSRSAAGRASRG